MSELGLHHIEQISRDVSRQEITFSHLLEDLIDHVCCDVENEMQKGLNFAEAYMRVKQKMGSRRLKEIQEETLYTVDTKYRYMKNTMKISGVAGTIMFGFAALFKIQHWPFASVMMSLGAFILAFVFLPSALSVLWKETHNRKRLFLFISAFFAGVFFILGTIFKIQHWPLAGALLSLAALSGVLFLIPAATISRIMDQENRAKRQVYIIGAAGIICYVAGLLFKIQHWPLATDLMAVGVFMTCFVAFPWFTWLTWKDENNVQARFIFIIIGSVLIIVPGALLNLNLEYSYNQGYYSHQGQQQAIYNYKYASNQSFITKYRDSADYPEMQQLHAKTVELLSLITNIQVKMIADSEGRIEISTVSPALKQTDYGPQIQYSYLTRPLEQAGEFLLPGSSSRQELNKALTEYENYLSDLKTAGDLSNYKRLIDPTVYLPSVLLAGHRISLMSGLHSLEILKNSLLTVETYMLKGITKS
jgi:hypothetical protein